VTLPDDSEPVDGGAASARSTLRASAAPACSAVRASAAPAASLDGESRSAIGGGGGAAVMTAERAGAAASRSGASRAAAAAADPDGAEDPGVSRDVGAGAPRAGAVWGGTD